MWKCPKCKTNNSAIEAVCVSCGTAHTTSDNTTANTIERIGQILYGLSIVESIIIVIVRFHALLKFFIGVFPFLFCQFSRDLTAIIQSND